MMSVNNNKKGIIKVGNETFSSDEEEEKLDFFPLTDENFLSPEAAYRQMIKPERIQLYRDFEDSPRIVASFFSILTPLDVKRIQ